MTGTWAREPGPRQKGSSVQSMWESLWEVLCGKARVYPVLRNTDQESHRPGFKSPLTLGNDYY